MNVSATRGPSLSMRTPTIEGTPVKSEDGNKLTLVKDDASTEEIKGQILDGSIAKSEIPKLVENGTISKDELPELIDGRALGNADLAVLLNEGLIDDDDLNALVNLDAISNTDVEDIKAVAGYSGAVEEMGGVDLIPHPIDEYIL